MKKHIYIACIFLLINSRNSKRDATIYFVKKKLNHLGGMGA